MKIDEIPKWNLIREYPERPSGEVEINLEYIGKPDTSDHSLWWNNENKRNRTKN